MNRTLKLRLLFRPFLARFYRKRPIVQREAKRSRNEEV